MFITLVFSFIQLANRELAVILSVLATGHSLARPPSDQWVTHWDLGSQYTLAQGTLAVLNHSVPSPTTRWVQGVSSGELWLHIPEP